MIALRRYVYADEKVFSELFADPETVRYVGEGNVLDAVQAAELFNKGLLIYETDPTFYLWAVSEDGEYAGHAELKRRNARTEYELVYVLQRKRWGRGLGGCVVDLLLDHARKRRIPFVIATVDLENAASVAILKKRGFVADDRLTAELKCPAYRRILGD